MSNLEQIDLVRVVRLPPYMEATCGASINPMATAYSTKRTLIMIHVIPVPPTEKKKPSENVLLLWLATRCLLHPNDCNAPLLIQQNNKMAYNDNIFEG